MILGRFYNREVLVVGLLTWCQILSRVRRGRPADERKGEVMDEVLEGVIASTWGEQHFGGLDLGDARRTRRLPELMDAMRRHPGGSLPDKLSDPAELRAFYRLMNAPEVTHASVLATHYGATREAISELVQAGQTVLIVHDATELDFSSKSTLWDQMGQIGQGTNRGYICHNSLAIRADTKATLGLTSQILHHRADVPKRESIKQCRERENRESRLWVAGAQASGSWSASEPVIDVSDRLSDTFEYMAFEIAQERQFVLRSRENRKLTTPINDQWYLYEALQTRRAVREWELEIPAGPGRAKRTALLRMSFTPVSLEVPTKKMGEYREEPLAVWAVRVWEVDAPPEVEPLEWVLLTNVPVTNSEQARERASWYECRFVIEEFHKGQKTGCGIEGLQFTTIGSLEPTIAVLSVLTTTLMQVRDAARAPDADQRPATEVVDPLYIEVLAQRYPQRLRGRVSIHKFYMHVARLGGHQNRKCDGFPGWLTLWRGWMKLEQMVHGYRLAMRPSRKTCGRT